MRRTVSIIIIDDTDQSTNIDALKVKLHGICDLAAVCIKTNDKLLRREGTGHLDPDKLRKRLEDEFSGSHFDWVLTDFNLSENDYDGLEVVKEISKIRPRVPVILYSGNLTAAIKKVLGKKAKDANEEDIIEAVREFIELPIKHYVGRGDYKETIYKLIKASCGASVEDEFLRLLHEHDDLVFNSCYPPFKGKTLGEIATMIESKSDARSREWILALVQQTISYLVKTNA